MQELGPKIIALTDTLYRVSCGLLRNEADREDAVQSAIEKAWRKAAFLRDEQKLKPWMTKILVHECYTILRKTKREIPTDALPETGGVFTNEICEAVLTLPEVLRLPIMLHYMEGFSIREISSALKCPQGTVLSRMNRGRKQLKNLLVEADDDDG